ncbi:hypothetical protein JQK15_18140 [Sphingobium sp. BHU LFT2]|uniref:hypothetical protein n=1 Tax=Sphingobium sp. BHU LFT2 TaxID=2807634 RepID=UPI001BE86325|nr:hypothetical protein [Sphingobium sp. BHU LFT2]MBT2245453.1 hypothetical protein [Sphingobium sp. BHU LFT2]
MLLIGVGALALLAIGLLTNNMPNSVGMPSREKNPYMFWALAMTYGLIGFTFVIKSLLG